MRSKVINKKDVKQNFGRKNPLKFTTRRKYMKIMVDRSIFAICSQNLWLRYGWMVSGLKKIATHDFFRRKIMKMIFTNVFLCRTFLLSISWTHFITVASNSTVSAAFSQNIYVAGRSSAAKSHLSGFPTWKTALMRLGEHNAKKWIPSRKTCWRLDIHLANFELRTSLVHSSRPS